MQFRTKIFIGSVVAAIVSLVASELWLARQVREEQQTALVDQLTAEANLIAHSLRDATADADFDTRGPRGRARGRRAASR